jgi:type I restriction enzyme R subunit
MNETAFRQSVPEVVQNKLHAVRKAGNHAAHPRRPITSQLSLECLWGSSSTSRAGSTCRSTAVSSSATPKYTPPRPSRNAAKTKDALEKLRLAEAKYESVLKRPRRGDQEAARGRTRRDGSTRTAEENASELTKLRDAGQKVASALEFNEATTRRRLIDQALLAAGWNVGSDGKNTEQVKQEVKLAGLPTPSGDGFADYVLYGDDGKPLAVIEAKKTAKDARAGGEQARQYADALEKETGRAPGRSSSPTGSTSSCGTTPKATRTARSTASTRRTASSTWSTSARTRRRSPRRAQPRDRRSHVPARSGQAGVRALREQLPQGAARASHGHGQDARRHLALRRADARGLGEAHPVPVRPRELRKQADRVFKEFMPGEPRVIVDASTANDRDKRIYLATYPAMMKCYEDFDVGFFDLIIADESHRSIYKKFRSLFQYFDALKVGLTATPVKFIERNTYELFGCENGDPDVGTSASRTPSSPSRRTSCPSA